MTSNIQVSAKLADGRIFVIGGDSAEDFMGNASAILGTDAATELADMFAVAMAGNGNAMEYAVNTVQSFSPAPTQGAPSLAPSGPAGSPTTETDKWGAVWTYGLSNAPSCPHGVRVQKKATSQAGKPYTAWVCPTHSPTAYRQKIQKDTNCAMEFQRG